MRKPVQLPLFKAFEIDETVDNQTRTHMLQQTNTEWKTDIARRITNCLTTMSIDNFNFVSSNIDNIIVINELQDQPQRSYGGNEITIE